MKRRTAATAPAVRNPNPVRIGPNSTDDAVAAASPFDSIVAIPIQYTPRIKRFAVRAFPNVTFPFILKVYGIQSQ